MESHQAYYFGPPPKPRSGWSQEETNQALQESARTQALKDNPNLMLGLSPLYREGIIHDLDIVPLMYYDIPTTDEK